jgi:hypothetical protein
MVHVMFDNRALARDYPTVASLRAAPEIARYVRWIRRRPGCTVYGARTRSEARRES